MSMETNFAEQKRSFMEQADQQAADSHRRDVEDRFGLLTWRDFILPYLTQDEANTIFAIEQAVFERNNWNMQEKLGREIIDRLRELYDGYTRQKSSQ